MSKFNTDYMLSRLLTDNLSSPGAIGYEKITVDGTAKKLTVPTGARSALAIVESSVTTGFVVSFLEYGAAPTSTTGLPRSHQDAIEVLGAENLTRFQIIQTQAGTHYLHVQYYS